jgi:hypothetical protein
VNTTIEGIITTDWVAAIWARGSFAVPLEQNTDINLAKDEILDLRNKQRFRFDLESVKLGRFW